MSREILVLADALAQKKNVSKNIIFSALEAGITSMAKRKLSADADVVVEINQENGFCNLYRRYLVVSEKRFNNKAAQILLADAKLRYAEIELSDFIEEEIEPVAFEQSLVQNILETDSDQLLKDHHARLEHFKKVDSDRLALKMVEHTMSV